MKIISFNIQNAIIQRKDLNDLLARRRMHLVDIDVSKIACSVMVTMIVQVVKTKNVSLACTTNW